MTGGAGERLARLLALVPWLVAHDGVTVAECAAHFGVTEEQLERDLWLLVVCGVPGYGPDQLVDIDFWDDGVIHVLDPQTLGRPLRLTSDEAVTLLVALRMLAQLPGIGDRDAIVTAAARIERLAGDGASARYVAVQVDVPAEITAAVDAALLEGRELRLTYAAATRDEVTERTVHPRQVLAVDGIGYLEAFCLSAGAVRTFRLDRIISAAVLGPIPVDDAAEPHESVGPARAAVPHEPSAVTALLEIGPRSRWLLDVHPGVQVVGAPADDPADGPVVARVPLHSLDWAVRLVLAQAGDVRPLEPVELVDAVRASARAALATYAGQVP
jgi:proteasome accessory factor C